MILMIKQLILYRQLLKLYANNNYLCSMDIYCFYIDAKINLYIQLEKKN